jgi:hypothetical protein
MDSSNWRVKRDPAEMPPKEQTRTPMRSYQQRRNNLNNSGFGGNSSSPFGNSPRSSPFEGQSRDDLRKPLGDGRVDKAIEEGRRLYVGNLPYEVSFGGSLLLRDVKGCLRTRSRFSSVKNHLRLDLGLLRARLIFLISMAPPGHFLKILENNEGF